MYLQDKADISNQLFISSNIISIIYKLDESFQPFCSGVLIKRTLMVLRYQALGGTFCKSTTNCYHFTPTSWSVTKIQWTATTWRDTKPHLKAKLKVSEHIFSTIRQQFLKPGSKKLDVNQAYNMSFCHLTSEVLSLQGYATLCTMENLCMCM